MALTRCPQLIPLGPSEPWPARPRPLLVRNAGPGQLAVFPLPLAPQWLVAVPLDRERLDLAVEAVLDARRSSAHWIARTFRSRGRFTRIPAAGNEKRSLNPEGTGRMPVVWPTSGSTWLRGWTGPGLPATDCSRSRRFWNAAMAASAGIGRSGSSWGLASRRARRTSMAGDCSGTAAMGVGSVAGVRIALARFTLGMGLLAVSGLQAEFHAGSPGVGLHVACRPPTPIRHAFPRRLSSQTVAHSLDSGKNFRDRWTQGPVALATGANRSPENAGPRSGIADLFGIA